MKNIFFVKYYRVYKNDTTVTEVSVNDFNPVILKRYKRGMPITPEANPSYLSYFSYSLPADESMFYGYLNEAAAMEKAKTGALAYIAEMIKEVETGIKKLQQYRIDHYQDLNINLLDENIRKFRKQMSIK